jgi:hypothetical protein
MKRVLVILITFVFAVPFPALQAQQQGQQKVMQVQCRDMASTGNFLAPNETIMNGMACHPVATPAQPAAPADPSSKPAPAPATSPSPAPATSTSPAPASAPAASASPAPVADNSAPNTPGAADSAPRAIVLEDGTPVNLVLDENVSSADAVTGQTVAFETVDDIVVNGYVVIPRGSTAWATVTDAQHKRRMGRAGHVDLNIDKVRLADGEKVLLRAVKDSQGGSNTGKMVGAMVATSIFTLGGSALFLLAHGKDTTIPKGTNVTAFIQGNVTLDEAKFQRQPTYSRGN